MADTNRVSDSGDLEKAASEDLSFLDPETLELRIEDGRLQRHREESDEWEEVSLVRLFPLTHQEKWISMVDKEDKEIGVLRTLHGLSHVSLAAAREEIRRRYLIPEIERILSCRDRFHLVEWTVETNRGRMTFVTAHLHEQVKPEMLPRITLTDPEGNRYDIPDVEALDPESRAILNARL